MVSAASREAWKQALWFVPILWTFHDLCASVHWVQAWSIAADTASSSTSSSSGRDVEDEGGVMVVVNRLMPRLYKFERGDVVLLRSPEDPRAALFRRLVGLEGDWIAVPGEAKIEKIEKGRCWVEGDLGAASEDSRSFGTVPLALIEGRASTICWPPSRWGRVRARLPPGRVIAMSSFAAGKGDDDDW